MDSVGVGELPDAAAYGDQGSDTVGNIAKRIPLAVPTLRRLGFDRIAKVGPIPPTVSDTHVPAIAEGAYGRMAAASAGKDSVTGHWELMGVVLDRAFPVFPNGFAEEVIRELLVKVAAASALPPASPATAGGDPTAGPAVGPSAAPPGRSHDDGNGASPGGL